MENLFKKVDKKVNTLKTFLQLSDNHQTLLSDHKPKIGDSSILYGPYCIYRPYSTVFLIFSFGMIKNDNQMVPVRVMNLGGYFKDDPLIFLSQLLNNRYAQLGRIIITQCVITL